jgi:hypothetical protein
MPQIPPRLTPVLVSGSVCGVFDFEKLLKRLADERNMIRQFPIHFCTVCILLLAIAFVCLYSSLGFVLHLKNSTIEGLKGENEVYKEKYGELSEKESQKGGKKDGHQSFDGLFEIPSGQSYVNVVVSLDFKPTGAIGTVMDSNYVIFASVD